MNIKKFFLNTKINIDLRPKMTWSIKGLCGTLCAGLSCTSQYSGYKKDYRGSTFSGIGAALSLLAYYMLANKESKAIEKQYERVFVQILEYRPTSLTIIKKDSRS